ncbi:hypothetical protein [Cupriavidus metallidurans]|uniref:DUF7940 domain-containing protein n=1 Tax=Cupriavidus metallidurans TaxID=119219 RepID=UPI001646C2DC|nr:hypothetical protein [Cupriavidus metallidurans]
MKLTLADNWRQLHKKGTVIFASFCAAITAFGPSIIDAWNALPPDLKGWLPQGMSRYLAIGAFLLTIVIRYTAVRRADKKEGDDAKDQS